MELWCGCGAVVVVSEVLFSSIKVGNIVVQVFFCEEDGLRRGRFAKRKVCKEKSLQREEFAKRKRIEYHERVFTPPDYL